MHMNITPELFEAFCHVLAYFFDDEHDDYDAQPPDLREGHVFESLAQISDFIDLIGKRLSTE